jgi:hypothetical protein
LRSAEALADITSSACDSQTTPQALLDCFDAAERVLNQALSAKPSA